MAGEPYSYWDFVKAAFWRPVRSRVLGAMPLTQMLLAAFGLAGLVNPGFWLLGLAAVVAFVGGRSSSARFQKLLAAERLAARAQSADDRMQQAYERLGPASQSRYGALVVLCREILGLAVPTSESHRVTDFRAGNLNQLLWLFLRLLSSREGIQDTLASVDRKQLEQEKRLANLDAATESFAVIDAELERIEQQVRLVREESAVVSGPEALSSRLDAVSATLSETSRWMDQHADLFTDLASSELDAARPPSLPRTPATEESREDPEPPRRPRPAQRQR
jgi:hypothetical protein